MEYLRLYWEHEFGGDRVLTVDMMVVACSRLRKVCEALPLCLEGVLYDLDECEYLPLIKI